MQTKDSNGCIRRFRRLMGMMLETGWDGCMNEYAMFSHTARWVVPIWDLDRRRCWAFGTFEPLDL